MSYHDLRSVLPDERICEKLSSFLEILSDYPGFKLLIEVKDASVPELLHLISLYDVTDQIEFQSFNPEICCELGDNLFAGRILLISESKLPLSRLESGGYSGCSLCYFRLDKGYLRHSHALGFCVYVWTVNSKKRAKQLLDMGVDCVIMDYSE